MEAVPPYAGMVELVDTSGLSPDCYEQCEFESRCRYYFFVKKGCMYERYDWNLQDQSCIVWWNYGIIRRIDSNNDFTSVEYNPNIYDNAATLTEINKVFRQ